ncbi:unnamed protein product [Cuscuta campestris]|uniref:Reverse transcriptase/retrotransposon-derived protein RNase H-like domain-containing protein n=1 Tax=Cuscuta campestris TaxID=132261 RepID=A0A484MS51_9ASTE|nr:unnamed protein product [Cuscuta campestris]
MQQLNLTVQQVQRDISGLLARVEKHGDDSGNRGGGRGPDLLHGGNPTSRLKIDMPKCDGTDPLGWLFKAHEYFTFYGIPEESRLSAVCLMLEASAAFEALKTALTTAPVLRLPDFGVIFVVETDASGTGIGAVLLQHEQPVAYFSKKLGTRRLAASTYHKELYAIVEAVQKWRQYLLGREFLIRTDQRSLRELLNQVIQTPDQQLYVRKLMGFRFRIEYKPGRANAAADALSRKFEDDAAAATFMEISQPLADVLTQIRHENTTQADLLRLHEAHRGGLLQPPYTVEDGLLFYNRRMCIGAASTLRAVLLREYHDSLSGGHAGVTRTFQRLASHFFWPHMRREVESPNPNDYVIYPDGSKKSDEVKNRKETLEGAYNLLT